MISPARQRSTWSKVLQNATDDFLDKTLSRRASTPLTTWAMRSKRVQTRRPISCARFSIRSPTASRSPQWQCNGIGGGIFSGGGFGSIFSGGGGLFSGLFSGGGFSGLGGASGPPVGGGGSAAAGGLGGGPARWRRRLLGGIFGPGWSLSAAGGRRLAAALEAWPAPLVAAGLAVCWAACCAAAYSEAWAVPRANSSAWMAAPALLGYWRHRRQLPLSHRPRSLAASWQRDRGAVLGGVTRRKPRLDLNVWWRDARVWARQQR